MCNSTVTVANTTTTTACTLHHLIQAYTAASVQDALAHFSEASWVKEESQPDLDKIFPMKTSNVRLTATPATAGSMCMQDKVMALLWRERIHASKRLIHHKFH